MMIQARGPVWHRTQHKPGMIPKGRTGVDTAAPWSDRKRDGWVSGLGTFCLVAGKSRILGAFKWRRNSSHEATRLGREPGKWQGWITTVLLDSTADDKARVFQLQRPRRLLLLTTTRQGADKSPARTRMRKVLTQRKHTRVYKQRSDTVEPRPGLVKDIFELEPCGMRGHANNRWRFAALGVGVQRHQDPAGQGGHSTWAINQEVRGR